MSPEGVATSFLSDIKTHKTLFKFLFTLVLEMGGDLATSKKDLQKPLFMLTVNNFFIWTP